MQAERFVRATTVVIYDTQNGSIHALETCQNILDKADVFAAIPQLASAADLLYGIKHAKCRETHEAVERINQWMASEETFCKLMFNPTKEGDGGFLTLALPTKEGFSPADSIHFFNELLKNPLLSSELIESFTVPLSIRLCMEERFEAAADLLRDVMKTPQMAHHRAYLIEGAQEAVDIKLSGKTFPPSLNFFIGKENEYFVDKFCPIPFNDFEVSFSGAVYICCPNHLPTVVGNLKLQSFTEVLNSPTARKIRQSILNGSFKFCNAAACPSINGDRLQTREQVTDPRMRDIIKRGVTELDNAVDVRLSIDPTCNLSCPSCRDAPKAAKGKELAFIEKITEDSVIPLLKKAKTVMMNGAGDVFSSKSCRKILQTVNKKDFPELKIKFITNAVLLTKKEWAKFPNIHDMVDWIRVSIDAVKEDTYNILRRGGNFNKLRKNLMFLSELRRKGVINTFEISFVFQKENMHEMVDFIEWGKDLNCDWVHFEPLMDWQSFDYPDYLGKAVHLHANPLYHEFIEIIRNPAFKRDYVLFDYPMEEA